MRVLDVGCGDGYLGKLLARRGYLVTGVERDGGTSPAFPHASVRLIVADLEQGLPPLPHACDYVLCADILEHLRQPGRLLAQIREHALAPGGTLVASLPNSGNIWFRLNILLGRFPQDDKGLFDRTHIRFYMWDGWQLLFAKAGFHFVSVQSSAIPVALVAPPQWSRSLLIRAAESVSYGMARLWKTLFAYQFVVSAKSLPE